MGEAANLAIGKSNSVLCFVPLPEIKRVRDRVKDPLLLSAVLSDIVRLNTLYMIRYTGSGHPGSSLSATDIITWLWTQEMVNPNEKDKDPSDTFFSSKGHDVPALYSLLIAFEKLPFHMLKKLRRLGGLPGHPDVKTPYIAANTGSLGMGISKARGMAAAYRLLGKKGRVYVMTGDGELQEGQIWEALQPTANQKFSEVTVIVDHNKIQSDVHVKDTSDLGDLEGKFRAFGWEVARCSGHDFGELARVFARFKTVKDRPQILIADTKKGGGVSFMEKLGEDGLYKFHSGAPSYEQYVEAVGEILVRINKNLARAGERKIAIEEEVMPVSGVQPQWQRLVPAYGDELVKIARERKNLVAMDADLVLDTGLVPFKAELPGQYVQCGIAEQDMVSFAGGLALKGILPVVNSFECFLTTRANEHFYNNATEGTKIIYAGFLAGLLPGMPGHSHQSVRGISVLGSIPGLVLIQPANEEETRMALRWAVEKNPKSTYIRLVSIGCECPYEFPQAYELEVGRGVFVREGKDAVLVAYGPTMLGEAVKAADVLLGRGISTAVLNFPWLNRFDAKWLCDKLKSYKLIVTLDDHYVTLGQGVQIADTLAQASSSHPRVLHFGVTEIPACGHNGEVLQYHRLDFESLAESIEKEFRP